MENPTHSFREMSLYRRAYIDEPISSYKKCELKVKLSWVVACKKKECFVTFILSDGNFFNILVFFNV